MNKKPPSSSKPKEIPPETVDFLDFFRNSIGSIATFFSVGYGAIIIISISYNVGFFKYVNPEFINLITLGDYADNVIDNMWLFLIFGSIFFGSTLGATKRHNEKKFKVIAFLGTALLIFSIYIFSKGEQNNHFWHSIGYLFSTKQTLWSIILFVGFIILIIGIVAYVFSSAFINNILPKYTTSIIAIVLFWILVITPYIFGMSTAIYEKEIVCSKDYKYQKVDLITIADNLKDVSIIKTTSKGLLVRIFKENNSNESNYIMVHWNDIRRIIYKN
jgi:hypothetical protein